MVEFYEGLARELSPYVRALAWWHAIPLPSAGNAADAATFKPARLSRMQMVAEADCEIDLPDLDPALGCFVNALFDAGPVSAAASGAVPLTWADLRAWQDGTGVDLPPWQLHLLRRLSAEYLAESQQAGDVDALPPWERELTTAQRIKVERHIKKIMRG